MPLNNAHYSSESLVSSVKQLTLGARVAKCPCGGIGRHAGLKILFAEKASTSSILVGGTISYCSLTYKEKQIMDTLSFILGIAFVVVIAVAIVAVYAFVKVRNLDRELSSVHQVIETEINNQNRLRENDRRDYENVIQDIYRAIDNNRNERKEDLRNLASQMNRSIDSRFDIFTNKHFPSQEQLKK
jgi:hypothetical protein